MLRRFAWFGAGLMAILCLYLTAAALGGVLAGPVARLPDSAPRHRVGLLAGPIHYDFLLPLTPEVHASFAFANADGVWLDHPDARFLIVGWGAHDFYTTVGRFADLNAHAVWTGLSGDRSVLRLQAIGDLASQDQITFLHLSDAQYTRLLALIAASVSRDAHDLPLVALTRPASGEVFYQSPLPFHAFHTCNVWLGEMLRGAGVPFGRWTPVTFAVRLSLWRFAR